MGNTNPPAATGRDAVMVVSGSTSEARLSQDAVAADEGAMIASPASRMETNMVLRRII
jgi:hypothetical protein